jgi:hypothetical protein
MKIQFGATKTVLEQAFTSCADAFGAHQKMDPALRETMVSALPTV